ncbi:MAG: adenosylcobinamide kinase / adenosylcobinamide-phosphate guanylyltransferase [Methylobacteriaceae bacterium]|jgi:adenosylcobinamide kinase/adenosylcobinamide-phosphate guanylyltransferase|nr:adenosylcobinamide kinase / adenosylcobinamide-phosphate guanylyltransferase [Methylobacteriaceae bacterium]
MAPLILVLGGARSGKSRHAERLICEYPPPWTYIATAEALDDEMRERIAQHRARRDERWQTLEAPHALADAVRNAPADQPLIVDCLTLWLSNRLLGDADLDQDMSGLSEVLGLRIAATIVVANEVGLGIVPDNALARRFRDAAGKANQMLAAQADHVEFVAAGLALRLK